MKIGKYIKKHTGDYSLPSGELIPIYMIYPETLTVTIIEETDESTDERYS